MQQEIREDDKNEEELRENLQTLKNASLQALNKLVRKLVTEEASSTKHSVTEPSSSSKVVRVIRNPVDDVKQEEAGSPCLTKPMHIKVLNENKKQMAPLIEKGKAVVESSNAGSIVSNGDTGKRNLLTNAPQIDALSQVNQTIPSKGASESNKSLDDSTAGSSDHNLAIALASLCNGLYTILSETEATINILQETASQKTTSVLSHLTNLKHLRPIGELPEAQQQLWTEMDRLMLMIQSICEKRIANTNLETTSSSSSSSSSKDLPTYEQALEDKSIIPDPHMELHSLIDSIERVHRCAPRLRKQDVILSKQKKEILSGLAIGSLVEKLMRHDNHFIDQRVDVSNSKFTKLNELMHNIVQSHKRSLGDQRAMVTPNHIQKMEIGKLTGIIDRQSKSRLSNQDWTSPEERLVEDLSKLQGELSKPIISSVNAKMGVQRFHLSEKKQKDMYISSLLNKVDKLENRRMGNQDALTPDDSKSRNFDEIGFLLDRLAPSFSDQRSNSKSSNGSGNGLATVSVASPKEIHNSRNASMSVGPKEFLNEFK